MHVMLFLFKSKFFYKVCRCLGVRLHQIVTVTFTLQQPLLNASPFNP